MSEDPETDGWCERSCSGIQDGESSPPRRKGFHGSASARCSCMRRRKCLKARPRPGHLPEFCAAALGVGGNECLGFGQARLLLPVRHAGVPSCAKRRAASLHLPGTLRRALALRLLDSMCQTRTKAAAATTAQSSCQQPSWTERKRLEGRWRQKTRG